MKSLKCTKCNTEMDAGYRIDNTYNRGGMSERRVKKSEVNINSNGSLSTNWRGRIKKEFVHLVSTYKCTECGYLESFVE